MRTKTGYEVDFLIEKNGKTSLIQVCYDLTNVETYSREKRPCSGTKELGLRTGLF